MHLVVAYGFQGAGDDAEKLSLTDQLFDAALRELALVGRGQLCVSAGDFNVEHTKIPCLLNGSRLGSRLICKGLGLERLELSRMLPASGTGLVVVLLGGTLLWGVLWRLLLLRVAGLIAVVGFNLISLFLPLLWLAGGLLRWFSLLVSLFFGLRLGFRR